MFQRIDSLLYVVVLSASIVIAAGNDLKEEDRRAHSDRGGLWFGPRLGKRSYQSDENNRDMYYRLMEAAEALRFYYDQLPEDPLDRRNEPENRVTKKVIFTPKLGRSLAEERQFADFTPRLGRATDDSPTQEQEVYRADDGIGTRTRYFSPRLGRNMNFSPRLGRELVYDNNVAMTTDLRWYVGYRNEYYTETADYPESVRVARSANKSNDTKTSKR